MKLTKTQFEILGELYYSRFKTKIPILENGDWDWTHLAVGTSDFVVWLSQQALADALDRIAALETEVENLNFEKEGHDEP